MYFAIIYCITAIIPMIIFFHCFHTIDKRIRNCRLRYAIPSIISIIYDGVIIYLVLSKKVTNDTPNPWITYAPLIITILALLFYQLRKKTERRIEADILKESAVDVMDLRNHHSGNRIEF